MEFSTKQLIAQGVKNYIETHSLSQADVARMTGVRKEHITNILKEGSQFLYNAGGKNGTGSIPTRHFNKLAELIGFTTDKVYWDVQPTEQMTNILATLKDAKEFGYTNVIIGQTGSGKSFVSKLFASKNPADVFIVKVGSADNISDLLDKVIDVLKIPTARTKSKKLRDIAKRLLQLKSDGYSPVLIFDESEYMKQPALCAMKELYDILNGFCATILIGTDQLLNNIESLRKRNKAGIPQFYRRIKFGIRVLPNIDTEFKQFLNDFEDKELVKFLQRNCENYGELHDALVPTMREADRLKEPLTVQLIKKVLNIPETRLVA